MTAKPARISDSVLGRSPDQLTLPERLELAGKFIALEIYHPETIPLRRIEAIGDSVVECIRTLKARGLDPARFEYSMLEPPY